MKIKEIAILLLLVLAVQPAVAVETGTVLKAEVIKKEPFTDAKTVATLNVGDKVNILKKDGGWLNVKSARGGGWVRMLSIRKGEAKKGKSVAESFAGLASGRAGTGKVVATTGIRGLNEEELKAAKFDAEELNLAESYMTTRAEAQSFANQGKLKPRSLDYLPLPQ
ncbi:MAG TPA: SH3 domain-containing protein [Gallionellaceae bacterium]|nr:SH3 domain-containing protein [Gallionellaceae bacterium]